MDIEGAARLLEQADAVADPCAGLSGLIDPGSTEQGYRVQQFAEAGHRAAGRLPVGYKIGLSSAAAQAIFGASEPMYGILYADRRDDADARIDMQRLCAPKLEGEILLRVGEPPAPEADDDALLASIASVHAAFEIADSRIADWRIGIGEAIADNACCGRFGIVEPGLQIGSVDLPGVPMTITVEGGDAPLSAGTGANCLGTPLAAYRWLVGKLAEHGRTLRPGEIILTGALGPMVTMAPDKRYTIAIGELGVLSVRS